ncbi:MAG TPA: hypothetical protein VH595_22005 [Verrucomicrobiae bacterium]|jgi:hypothetical protein|nr:hypothetical protein [Verrucomicrobiae bacterium]
MKKETQARADRKASKAENQTSNAGASREEIEAKLQLAAEKTAAAWDEENTLVKQYLTPPELTPIDTDPFGEFDAPEWITQARRHILRTFLAQERLNYREAADHLNDLSCCVAFHPGLTTEKQAIDDIYNGVNVLTGLKSAYIGAIERPSLTSTEKWLILRLELCDQTTLRTLGEKLRGVHLLLIDNESLSPLSKIWEAHLKLESLGSCLH